MWQQGKNSFPPLQLSLLLGKFKSRGAKHKYIPGSKNFPHLHSPGRAEVRGLRAGLGSGTHLLPVNVRHHRASNHDKNNTIHLWLNGCISYLILIHTVSIHFTHPAVLCIYQLETSLFFHANLHFLEICLMNLASGFLAKQTSFMNLWFLFDFQPSILISLHAKRYHLTSC